MSGAGADPWAVVEDGPTDAFTEDHAREAIDRLAPGSQITSQYRTPQHNADVGGVSDSQHMDASATDVVLPKGVTAAQFQKNLKDQGYPVTEFLDEGNHVHWGWGPKGNQPQPANDPWAVVPAGQKAAAPSDPWSVVGELPDEGVLPGKVFLNSKLAPTVPDGSPRPFAPGEYVQNPDGSWSSEITATVKDKRLNRGRPTNIPTLWLVNGKPVRVSEDQAADYAAQSQLPFESYHSMKAAEFASNEREKTWQTVNPQSAAQVPSLWSAGQNLAPFIDMIHQMANEQPKPKSAGSLLTQFRQADEPDWAGSNESFGDTAAGAKDAGSGVMKAIQTAPAVGKRLAASVMKLVGEHPEMLDQRAGPLADLFLNRTPEVSKQTADRQAKMAAELAAQGQQMYANAAAAIKEQAPGADAQLAERLAYQLTSGTIEILPIIAVTGATGDPLVGGALIGAQAGASKYGEARASGRNAQQAAQDATFSGITNGALGSLPLHVLMKPGQTFLAKTLQSAGSFGAISVVTEAVQFGYDKGLVTPDMSWSEAWPRLVNAGVVGTLQGALLGGGPAALRAAVDRLHSNVKPAAPAQPPADNRVEPGPAAVPGQSAPQPSSSPPGPAAGQPPPLDPNNPAVRQAAAAAQTSRELGPVEASVRQALGLERPGVAPTVLPDASRAPLTPAAPTPEVTPHPDLEPAFAAEVKRIEARQATIPKDSDHAAAILARSGGIRNDEGHDLIKGRGLQQFVPGVGHLVRPGGMSIDAAGEVLWNEGFWGNPDITPRPTENQVLQLLERTRRDDDGKPTKVYAADRQAEIDAAAEGKRAEAHNEAARDDIRSYAKKFGHDPSPDEVEQVLADMGHHGIGPDVAVDEHLERLASQEVHHDHEETGRYPEAEDVPFGDEPAEPHRSAGPGVEGFEPAGGHEGVQGNTGPAVAPHPGEAGALSEKFQDLQNKRFEIGKSLTPDERKKTIASLADVYRENNLPKVSKGQDRRGEEIWGYPYTPELFRKSDITGAAVRHYVTLPDGRIAHPTELFQNYTQKDIDAEMARRKHEARVINDTVKRYTRPELLFPSEQALAQHWDTESHKSMIANGGRHATIYPQSERTTFSDGTNFMSMPKDIAARGDYREALAESGWRTPVAIPLSTERGAEGFDQTIIPGTEKSARQIAQSREDAGRGRMKPRTEQRDAGGMFEDKSQQTKDLFQTLDRRQFFSALTRSIEETKMTKAPAKDWLGLIDNLRAKGVKNEEIDWSGVKDWLQGKSGPVTKAEVLEHLRGNEVQVQEVEKGAPVPSGYTVSSAGTRGGDNAPVTQYETEAEAKAELARREREYPHGYHNIAELPKREALTKYGSYTLPGGPLSRDTEILSDAGWRRMDAVRIGDVVLTRRDETGRLEWQRVEAVPQVFAAELYHFRNQSIDMQVTADHQMVVKRRRRSPHGMLRVTAEKLWKMSECVAPLTGKWTGGSDKRLFGLDAGDVAEFLGWYLSEGSYKHHNGVKNTIQIAQCDKHNPDNCKRIAQLCERMGLRAKYYGGAFGVGIKKMPKEMAAMLHEQPTSSGKYVPQMFFKMKRPVIERLLDALILGDGCKSKPKGRRKGQTVFSSNSHRLAGDVQVLTLLVGKHATVRRRKSGLYCVSIRDREWASIDDAKHAIVPYNDTAFCVTVKNHAIYVRRNGVATFTGNSNYRELLLTLPETKVDAGPRPEHLTELPPDWHVSFDRTAPEGRQFSVIHAGQIHGRPYMDRTFATPEHATANAINNLNLENLHKWKESQKSTAYRSGHWDEPNVLAHIRFDDRTGPNGEKVLHIAEVQSDWHQAGRKRGYASDKADARKKFAANSDARMQLFADAGRRGETADQVRASDEFKRLEAEAENIKQRMAGVGVPDAPFKSTWHELAMKRVLRYGAEHGYDRLSWDTGETNAERYDLSKQISNVLWFPKEESYLAPHQNLLEAYDHQGRKVIEKKATAEQLPDIIGKEAADRLIRAESADSHRGRVKQLRGLDLKVGGEGMKGFYDRILPQFVNKYAKKWGAKVEQSKIGADKPTTRYEGQAPTKEQIQAVSDAIHARPTDQRFVSPVTGKRLEYQINRASNERAFRDVMKEMERGKSFADAMAWAGSHDIAKIFGGEMVEDKTAATSPVHSIPITDAMRASVMQGQPLFQAGQERIARPSGAREQITEQTTATHPDNPSRAEQHVIDEVTKIANRIVPDAKVIPARRLEISDARQKESGIGRVIAGVTNVHGQHFLGMRALIAWSLESPDAHGTLRHEAIHYLKGDGYLDEPEWKILEKAAQTGNWIGKHNVNTRWPNLPPEGKIEEAVAEGYATWKRAPNAVPQAVRPIFEKIARILAQVGAYLRRTFGRDATADDIFSRIESGEVGKREPGWSPYKAGDKFDVPTEAAPGATFGARIKKMADGLLDLRDDFLMHVAPMAVGTPQARAVAKDFANAMRLAQWHGGRMMDGLKKNFDHTQLKRMWEAADEESVLRQEGKPTDWHGLSTLPADERQAVQEQQVDAQNVWNAAKEAGMVEGEGLPSYVPRMMVEMAGGQIQRLGSSGDVRSIPGMGRNVRTSTPQMKHRKYLTTGETEGAASKKFETQAEVVKDIRTLPLATMRMREAVAGRSLINKIKEMGKATGEETVVEGHEPAGTPYKWFTINNPAFQTWRPRFLKNEETGKYEPMTDQNGEMVFEKVPIYVRGDFEGPLRSVLTGDNSRIYNGLMQLKGRAMTAIMYSPLIHNMVEWGRALPAVPGKVFFGVIYFEGNAAKKDPQIMSEAIMHGLVPIGHQAGFQDITSIANADSIAPGRSLTSKILAAVPGLFDRRAGDAVKRTIDKMGDFWHNTLLWDRIGDLQMGLYVNMRKGLIKKGQSPENASYIAAHFANRYAGALPMESMSNNARKLANLTMFSRTYTLGNLGAMKDMITGLPKDVQSQIERTGGIDQLKGVRSLAVRKAISVFLIDTALFYATNAAMQSALSYISGRKDLSDIERGYVDRALALSNRIKESPSDLLHIFDNIQSLSSTSENEPGRENRFFVGYDRDGTAIYGRATPGKIGEEYVNWLNSPIKTAISKMSTFLKPTYQTITNDAGFGRHVYDPNAKGFTGMVKNLGSIVQLYLSDQVPIDSLKSGYNLMAGKGTKLDAFKTIGPLAGVTFSKGATGGPALGELYNLRRENDAKMAAEMPAVIQKIKAGDIAGARADMKSLGIAPQLQNYYIRTTRNPQLKFNTRSNRQLLRNAAPDVRDRIERMRGEQ